MKFTTKHRALVAIGLIMVLGTVLTVFFVVRVCEDQLAGNGQVVTVCRHLATTDPPMVVLGVVVLVLLSAFYAEISGFGVTLKHKVAEIEQRTEDNERTADDLVETVGDLTDFNRRQILTTQTAGDVQVREQVPDPRIRDLAKRYNTLRWTMPSGRERTRRMTEVAHQLRAALRDASDFDVLAHLEHDDRGVRLAAYAYLRDHPEPGLVEPLVAAAAVEEKPFGQYAALRAVLHQLEAGAQLGEHDRRVLRSMRDEVGADSDRGQLISAILSGDSSRLGPDGA
jgi:hypothetical protein